MCCSLLPTQAQAIYLYNFCVALWCASVRPITACRCLSGSDRLSLMISGSIQVVSVCGTLSAKMDIRRFLKRRCSVSPSKNANTRSRLQSKSKERHHYLYTPSLLGGYVYCVAGQRGTKLIFLSQCNLSYKVTTNSVGDVGICHHFVGK